jgi:hypothetical protein
MHGYDLLSTTCIKVVSLVHNYVEYYAMKKSEAGGTAP